MLLDAGADPDLPDNNGWVPLALAAVSGHVKLVDLLLSYEATIDEGTATGNSALMIAAAVGHTEIVRRLLANGANPEAQSPDGATALGYAYSEGRTQIAELLLAASGESQQERDESHQQIYSDITEALVFSSGPYPDHLPEGQTIFYGEYSCAQGLAGSVVVLNQSGGDVTLINLHGPPVSSANPQPVGYFRTVGTYNPDSNRFTGIPDEWIVLQSPGWIMSGRDGVYDPETGRLDGRVLIGATWADGRPLCSTFSHRRIEAPESMRALLDQPARPPSTLIGIPRSLPVSLSRWTGDFQCEGICYGMELTLEHSDGGRLDGTLRLSREDGDRLSAVTQLIGTHNPDSGRLTLGPTAWVGGTPPAGYHRMYHLDGHFHEPPDGLVVRIVSDSGPCADSALVRLAREE